MVHVKKEVGNILIALLYDISFILIGAITAAWFIYSLACYFNEKRNYEDAKVLLDEVYDNLIKEYNCESLNITTTYNLPFLVSKTKSGAIVVTSVSDENIEYFFQAKQCFEKHSSNEMLSDEYFVRVSETLELVTI